MRADPVLRGRVSARRIVVAALALLVVACGPPISVRRVPPRTVTAELARSALNSNRPSLFSENVLYRWGLTERFETDPEGALRELHALVFAGKASTNTLFALAELCFHHADHSGKREYYLASVLYAYAFLFPGEADEPPGELDPRARIAAELYNRGLTEAFASTDERQVELRSGLYPLPSGQQLAVYLDEQSLVWANQQLYGFVPVAELAVSGLGSTYRRPGIGSSTAPRRARGVGSTCAAADGGDRPQPGRAAHQDDGHRLGRHLLAGYQPQAAGPVERERGDARADLLRPC